MGGPCYECLDELCLEYQICPSSIYVLGHGRTGEVGAFLSLKPKSNVAWAARSGSQHLEFLLDKRLIRLRPSTILRFAYTEAAMDKFVKQIDDEVENIKKDSRNGMKVKEPNEQMLLSSSSGALIAERLGIPGIQMEIDRAVWQVERAIKAQQDKEISNKEKTSHEKSEQRS